MMYKILPYIIITILFASCQNTQKEKKLIENDIANEKPKIVYKKANEEIIGLINDLIQGGRLRKFDSNKYRIYEIINPDIHEFYFLEGHDSMVKRWMDIDLFTKYKNDLATKIDSTHHYRLDIKQFSNINIQLVTKNTVDLNHTDPDKENNFEPFYRIYTPIFSSDGKLVILPIDFICVGLCSENWHLVFQNTDNKWVEVALIPGTIS